jgi:hypothetical protein
MGYSKRYSKFRQDKALSYARAPAHYVLRNLDLYHEFKLLSQYDALYFLNHAAVNMRVITIRIKYISSKNNRTECLQMHRLKRYYKQVKTMTND